MEFSSNLREDQCQKVRPVFRTFFKIRIFKEQTHYQVRWGLFCESSENAIEDKDIVTRHMRLTED